MPPLAAADELSRKDQKYLTETAQGLMAEIQQGEMAQKQGHDERVRQFGSSASAWSRITART